MAQELTGAASMTVQFHQTEVKMAWQFSAIDILPRCPRPAQSEALSFI